MIADKKQRRVELSFLESLSRSPRWFVPIMDDAIKSGVSDVCFQHNDTRSAWIAVHALFKSNNSEWRKKSSSDDIAIKMAVEETVDRKELAESRPEEPSLTAAIGLSRILVVNSEKFGFKSTLETAVKMVDACSDVQTAVLISKQSIARWETSANVRNNAIDIGMVADSLATRYTEAHEAVARGDRVDAKGLQMPWEVLNDPYNGMKVGLNVVAARTSEGKSNILVNLSAFWKQRGVKHAVITLDMPTDEIVKRYGCMETELTDKRLSKGLASKAEIEGYRQAIHSYRESTFLYETPELASVEMAIREAHHNGAKSVFIDFLQLVYVKGCKNKWDSIQVSTLALKQLALELKMPMIVLAQLNRQGVKDGREPELHDIEGGGFIEQAAASVLTIGRDKDVCKQWEQSPPDYLTGGNAGLARWLRPVWLNLLKNQNGAIGKFPFVMYCPFFALRPANHDAVAETAKGACATLPFFNEIRDDWRTFSFDEKTERPCADAYDR